MTFKDIWFGTIILVVAVLLCSFIAIPSFLKQQLKFPRVKEAYNHSYNQILSKLKVLKIEQSKVNILLIGYKQEKSLNIYIRNKSGLFTLFNTYDVCSQSGDLGPKFKSGDYQTPEGFYHIDRFNPSSNFYLSLGINYPNSADKNRSHAGNLGGDIFIHGNCVSIGCFAMTDKIIKEIYILSVLAKNAGQSKIPVIISPFNFNDSKNKNFTKNINYQSYSDYFELWNSIKKGINIFKTTKSSPKITIDKKGNYKFQ
jgi:murein L,D-transpeptidase YafK